MKECILLTVSGGIQSIMAMKIWQLEYEATLSQEAE